MTLDIASVPVLDALPTPAVIDGSRHKLVIDGSTLRRIEQRVEDEYASLLANGGKMVFPHLIANRWPERALALASKGNLNANFNSYADAEIGAMFDFADAFDEAMYEAMKTVPGGVIVLYGMYATSRALYVPPAGGHIVGFGRNASQVFFNGNQGEDFLVLGDKNVIETALPIESFVEAGGRTTITIAAAGARHRPAPNEAPIEGDFRPLAFDPWGSWLGEFEKVGIRDGASTATSGASETTAANYAQMEMVGFDLAARTITVEGSLSALSVTPAFVGLPSFEEDGGVLSRNATDSHPRHIHETIRDVQFHANDKGVIRFEYERGVKGRYDPETMIRSLKVIKPYDVVLSLESDAHIDNLVVSQPVGDGPSLAAVDSTFNDLLVFSSKKVGLRMEPDFGQSFFTGKSKFYYLSQEAENEAEARSIAFTSRVNGVHLSGAWIIEDTAGAALYFGNKCANIHLSQVEMNNLGAIGLGAPGTVGWRRWWPSDCVRIGRNATVSDITVKGVCRANITNRDGFHVRSALYVEKATGVASAGDFGAGPHAIRDLHVDLQFVSADATMVPANLLPDTRQPLYDAGTAYARGDVVQTVDSARAIRWEASQAVPAGTAPPADETVLNDPHWDHVGGGRNAWEAAVIIEEANDEAELVEFKGCVVKVNGRRDPTYHQRILSFRSAYTVDYEQDLVRGDLTGASGDMVLDVYAGPDGKEQVWRCENRTGSHDVVVQPGGRSAALGNQVAGVYERDTSVNWTGSGDIGARLSREGAECRTVHREGRVHFLPHDQTEVMADADLALDLSDYGKTLLVPASAARTVSGPAGTLPRGWRVTLVNTGTANIDASAVGAGTITPGESVQVMEMD